MKCRKSWKETVVVILSFGRCMLSFCKLQYCFLEVSILFFWTMHPVLLEVEILHLWKQLSLLYNVTRNAYTKWESAFERMLTVLWPHSRYINTDGSDSLHNAFIQFHIYEHSKNPISVLSNINSMLLYVNLSHLVQFKT